ncbi:UvrD-helicase domain-containing protein [Halorarum salinum]|uniref:DNA 3'-5' helicase n=1 Tax=Halorarum salinum TaxID=2743089 RepID=A0A7D5QJA8_9EURY|nr:ATP-dependent helicase [Halobaculum salinum]QLG63604.1 ATP-dependent helicase [Halobaculum salinum]
MTEPNGQQRRLIESTEGVHLVDAGPGTGKTFTITRRYANLVDGGDVEPDDVLLVTFTNNAATEMRDRIVAHSDYGVRELRDAPIGTFHGLCHDVLLEHGVHAPTLLGIDDRITRATRLVDDETVERELFREFYGRFADDHPEHEPFLRVVEEPTELLGLVNQLAAKGVFPTEEGWYRNGERHLDGDFEAFAETFEAGNRPRNGGGKQSRIRERLGSYGRGKCYRADAPSRAELRGEGTKRVPDGTAELLFEDDREALKSFVHDVYRGYLAFALRRNYLTFGFLQLFAFVLLCEDHDLREELAFEHVMVDEFQDSSEIQFKLALLLAGTDNLCVVGDWKQSIYSFQYAAVENVAEFEARLERFAAELNDDRERVGLPIDGVSRLELVENYRSTQAIIDFAERALVTPATGGDEVDPAAVRDRIVPLESNAAFGNSRIEAISHEDEHEAVLAKVQSIVGDEAYAIERDGELVAPGYGDVAVLTRTRDYGRELLEVAREYDLPMAYEGGVELFRTDQAKLLLAWLRILESDADRGWAVVLEEAGYSFEEVRHVLEEGTYPGNMRAFRTELAGANGVGGVARRVFSRYGYDGGVAATVLDAVESVRAATTMTRGDLIRFLERGVESGATREVSAGAGADSVTVRTIHATKGLEHPIVVLANMNANRFPPGGGGAGTITFEDPLGLRARRVYAEDHGHPHVYHDWRTDALRRCLPTEYDEERRLLYVALTRAERHLVFAAGGEPNAFLEELPVDIGTVEPTVRRADAGGTEQATLGFSVPTPEGPVGYTPHTLMREEAFSGTADGRGAAYGTDVHEFAERYALGETDDPPARLEPDAGHVVDLLDSLGGELRPEEEIVLPLEVDGERVVLSGLADLVHVRPGTVEVVDFKTDTTRRAHGEYRKQVSVYHRVLDEWFTDRTVDAHVHYTYDGDLVPVDPLPVTDLVDLLREEGATPTAP